MQRQRPKQVASVCDDPATLCRNPECLGTVKAYMQTALSAVSEGGSSTSGEPSGPPKMGVIELMHEVLMSGEGRSELGTAAAGPKG